MKRFFFIPLGISGAYEKLRVPDDREQYKHKSIYGSVCLEARMQDSNWCVRLFHLDRKVSEWNVGPNCIPELIKLEMR